MPGEESPRKRPVTFLRTVAFAVELPFILVGSVVIGGGLGWWLDTKAGTKPLLVVVLGLLGFVAGLREVLRRIPKDNKGRSRNDIG
ncbi:MAG: AtpZ/AtpI family protein [Firmicutes bacterium]|nr:AtpZ/AtpI family protein [Bacillota bacterium]